MDNSRRAPLTHDQVLDYLPAYVLGTLDPDELLAVDDYLQAHPDLMPRVEELETAAAQLAYAAPPAPLPPGLEARVMAHARADLPPTLGRVLHPPRPAPPTWGELLAVWWRERGIFDVTLLGTAIAALLLAFGLGRAILQLDDLTRQNLTLRDQVTALQADNTVLLDENVRLQQEVQARQNQLAAVAGATDLVALTGTATAPQASAALYVRGGEATLVINNLDPPAAEQTYQLWLLPAAGAPISAGLLGSAGRPQQMVVVALPAAVEAFAGVGVSLEPAAGSPTPTGPMVLMGTIP